MDIKAIIESGILEQYVLGLLSKEETATVEQYAKDHPEIRSALNDIEDALATVAQSGTIPMPKHLPSKILSKIDELEADGRPNAPVQQKTNFSFYILLVVSILLALLSYYLYTQNQSYQESLSQQQQQYAELEENCGEEKNLLQAKLELIRTKGNQQIILGGTENAPEAIASVYYNTERQKTYFDVMSLPDIPNGKQYQLWALKDGEDPTDMGVFDVDPNSNTLIEVPFVEGAIGFAVTVEDEGGSPTPTLETMVIVGTIG
jgi:anti-sigma-K factor RskA